MRGRTLTVQRSSTEIAPFVALTFRALITSPFVINGLHLTEKNRRGCPNLLLHLLPSRRSPDPTAIQTPAPTTNPCPPSMTADVNAQLSPPGGHAPLSYGTAGFRGPASTLHRAILRTGALAAFRSHKLQNRPVGLMITASHNPAADNGVKIVEPDGSMLTAVWESAATSFINAQQTPVDALSHLVYPSSIKPGEPRVVLGWDTRVSSPELVQLARLGAEIVGATVELFGMVTTPQLHFSLQQRDRGLPCSLEVYYETLRTAFARLTNGRRPVVEELAVDCACGVGAKAVDAVVTSLTGGKVHVVNRPEDGVLNLECGADFVQKKREMPQVYSKEVPTCRTWASLDGDADRLVMFQRADDGEKRVLLADGDRFAALVTSFLAKHMRRAQVDGLSVAVAQTAYSNGSATEFLGRMPGVKIVVAKTGVKHLEEAVRKFDVGIYWEPNGHGTVLFSDRAVDALAVAHEGTMREAVDLERRTSLSMLIAVSELANQAVGDGVADLLLVLGILSCEGMSFTNWVKLYDERCSSNLVVRVADKTVIKTMDCDRFVKEPVALREVIEKVSGAEGCRAFVRPSGTEDVVRVYAEAPVGRDDLARDMAICIGRAVFELCGGVGSLPNWQASVQ